MNRVAADLRTDIEWALLYMVVVCFACSWIHFIYNVFVEPDFDPPMRMYAYYQSTTVFTMGCMVVAYHTKQEFEKFAFPLMIGLVYGGVSTIMMIYFGFAYTSWFISPSVFTWCILTHAIHPFTRLFMAMIWMYMKKKESFEL